ncbi:PAS domain-containing protein [Candidatus Poribacteria bacterium]|nr:PAS domain-containing protein [Candidatus Poribacteria bacterium]
MDDKEIRRRKSGEILQSIFNRRGFDFRVYNLADIQKIISSRMEILQITDLDDYQQYLEIHSDEYGYLFNSILVNVTQFFRDPDIWEYVKSNIIPEILKSKDEIKIWTIGCASGEEAYSLAIALSEILDDKILDYNINIYATDIDEPALKIAKSGNYDIEQLAGLDEYLKNKYFIRYDDTYTIDNRIKSLITFTRHNLVSDPPLSRIDLLLCRNVLIYFDRFLRSGIISKLQYALRENGYLWLGKAEIIDTDNTSLKLLDSEKRIFKKISLSVPQESNNLFSPSELLFSNKEVDELFRDIIGNLQIAFIFVNKKGMILICNKAIESIWKVKPDEIIGKNLFEIHISHSPLDLKKRIKEVLSNNKPLFINKIEHWPTEDKRLYLDMRIVPIQSGIVIFASDLTETYETWEEIKIVNETLEIENEKKVVERQQLMGKIAELRSINAQLMSENEELEFANDGLISTKEELNNRIAVLIKAKNYYEILIEEMDTGVIILDNQMTIKSCNQAAYNIMDVYEEILGNNLKDFNAEVPLKQLEDDISIVIKQRNPVKKTMEFISPDGQKKLVDVSIKLVKVDNPDTNEPVILININSEISTHNVKGARIRLAPSGINMVKNSYDISQDTK